LTQAGKAYTLGDQTGKTYIVTGASDGIGKSVAEALARKKARVIMACRDRNKCLEARRDIVFETKNKEVYCRICDMSDYDSIRNFAGKVLKGKHEIDRIDGILHNAATVEPKRKVNKEGIELSLVTNHLGPFLLTGLLLQKLLDQPHPSKIVFLNDAVASKSRIEIDLNAINDAKYTRKGKPDLTNGKYYGGDAYIYSKALELCFSRELAERLKTSNVTTLSVYPGWTRTKLEKRIRFKPIFWVTSRFLRRPEKAIKPVLFALTDRETGNGLFIGREMEPIEWGTNAENTEIREKNLGDERKVD